MSFFSLTSEILAAAEEDAFDEHEENIGGFENFSNTDGTSQRVQKGLITAKPKYRRGALGNFDPETKAVVRNARQKLIVWMWCEDMFPNPTKLWKKATDVLNELIQGLNFSGILHLL